MLTSLLWILPVQKNGKRAVESSAEQEGSRQSLTHMLSMTFRNCKVTGSTGKWEGPLPNPVVLQRVLGREGQGVCVKTMRQLWKVWGGAAFVPCLEKRVCLHPLEVAETPICSIPQWHDLEERAFPSPSMQFVNFRCNLLKIKYEKTPLNWDS